MSKPTKAHLLYALEAEQTALRVARKIHANELEVERKLTFGEQQQRIAAQRGLVPYVRSLEQFNAWLAERPALSKEIEPILRELGLWDIKLGYDPDEDLTLSVVGPKRS